MLSALAAKFLQGVLALAHVSTRCTWKKENRLVLGETCYSQGCLRLIQHCCLDQQDQEEEITALTPNLMWYFPEIRDTDINSQIIQ